MSTQQLDPVNVGIAIAGVVFGPVLAGIIGPYAVILIGSTVGAAWSLGRRDQTAKMGAAWYFLRINLTALLVTVGLATLAGKWLGVEDSRYLLAPIALIVGGVGDDWPRLARWVLMLRLRALLGKGDKS